MKGKRFTEEQIIGVLFEAEEAGNIREVCRLHEISEQTFSLLSIGAEQRERLPL